MHMTRSLAIGLITTLLCLSLSLPAFATPAKLSQQGRLIDGEGEPLDGAHQITFRLYDEASEGSLLWSESRNLDLNDGYYATTLGDQTPLDEDLFAGGAWLELTVDGEVLEPRHQVVSVPSALRSVVAEHVDGGVVDAAEIWVGGQQVIDDTGAWVGAGGANSWDDLSDIPPELADGDGDALGDLSCFDGGGPKWNAATSQWLCSIDGDTLGNMSCGNGQLAIWDSVAGQWVCGSDTDTLGTPPDWSELTGIPSDLADGDADTLLGLPCIDGQVPTYDSTSALWICAAPSGMDTLALLSCVGGELVTWDDSNSQWVCSSDADTQLSETQVENFITNDALDLSADSSMAGVILATQDDLTTSLPWSSITGVPGDSDTLLGLFCADGFVAKYSASLGAWDCAEDNDSFAALVCQAAEIPVYEATSGMWVCGQDLDSDSQLTETQVDDFVANNGYSLGAHTVNTDTQLTESQVDDFVANNGYSLGAHTVNTDTLAGLSCANGGVPVWDALLTQWTCALSSDTVLTEGEVEAYVINGAIDLNAATTMGGQALATVDQLTGIDFSTLSGVPTDLADGDDILTETEVETFITNAPIDLPAGTTINGEVIGAGANLGSNVTIGAVVPGDNYLTDHTSSPVPIPDDNVFGFNSPRFVAGGTTSINNFSVDVNITHPEMGDLRITLYAPDDTAVLMYDGELAGSSNMVGNIARDFAISGGTIYALYGKDANGTWRLEVIDTASGNAGTLNSWALNINETWSGDLFVGNSITSDGDITTTGNIEVIQGSDLIFKNTAGTETLRISGETGQISGASGNCPTGMTQVADYCVENNQRSGNSNWQDAMRRCQDPTYNSNDNGRPAGLRLCTGGEWMMGCQTARDGNAPSISGMHNSGWEWIFETAGRCCDARRAERCNDIGIDRQHWSNGNEVRCCKDL